MQRCKRHRPSPGSAIIVVAWLDGTPVLVLVRHNEEPMVTESNGPEGPITGEHSFNFDTSSSSSSSALHIHLWMFLTIGDFYAPGFATGTTKLES